MAHVRLDVAGSTEAAAPTPAVRAPPRKFGSSSSTGVTAAPAPAVAPARKTTPLEPPVQEPTKASPKADSQMSTGLYLYSSFAFYYQ
jgi:hypothetical protein